MSTTTGGGLRAPLRPLVHVGGGVDRRAVYHEEQAALREALQRGTATIHGDRMLSSVVVTVSAANIVVHADAPNYRPPSTTVTRYKASPNVNLGGLFTVKQDADFRTVALSRRRGHATVMLSRCEA